jgi:valyl-tRNA synthetase
VLAVFETSLRLLHPVMPFLTEELWHRLAGSAKNRPRSIALASFPAYRQETTDHQAERDMDLLQDIVTSARTLRAEMKLDPKESLDAALYSTGRAAAVARDCVEAIGKLATIRLTVHEGAAPKLGGASRATPEYDLLLRVPQAQVDAQRKRLAKEIQQLEKNVDSLRLQLGNNGFIGRAPAHVVEGMRSKLSEYEAQLVKSRAALEALG